MCFSIHKRIEGGATRNPKKKKTHSNQSFSIHKRIEGGATKILIAHPRLDKLFQYPQADRRGCNNIETTKIRPPLWVSVSTSGSKGVQLCIHKRNNTILFEFQYPQADRRGCNEIMGHGRAAFGGVSVSTSGSKGVQPQTCVKSLCS